MTAKNELPFLIGAGPGRTGTHSLQAALISLGYNKPFHMKEILAGHVQPDNWFALAKHERTTGTKNQTMALEVAQSVLDLGYTAVTDYPTCLLFEEFLLLKPNAKVILTIRKSPEQWKQSVSETIGVIAKPLLKPPYSFLPFYQNFAGFLDPWLWERTGIVKLGQINTKNGESIMDYEERMEQGYLDWIDFVKSKVPAEQLLIHHPSDGYAPICDLLQIEQAKCPKGPYPHLGDTAEMKQLIRTYHRVNQAFAVLVGILFLSIAVWVQRKLSSSDANKRSKDNTGKQE